MNTLYHYLMLFFLISPFLTYSQSLISEEDAATAAVLKKKFKNEPYAAITMTQRFTFSRSKNEFKHPIVTVKETGSVEFIALKDIAVFQYFKYHNHFIKLNSFYRYDKYLKRYNLSGKSGFDKSVTNDNIFFDDARLQLYSFRFLEKGKMAKLTWEQEYTDAKYLTRSFFNEYFPIADKVIEFEVPEWLDISFIEKNFEKFKIVKGKENSGKSVVYSFKVKDAPAIKSEPSDLGMAYTEPHIIIQIKSFENDGQKVRHFQNTADLYNWYRELYNMAKNDNSALKSQVTRLIEGKKTDEDKIKAIYYWVQDN